MTAAQDLTGGFDGTYHGDVRCFVPGLHLDSAQAVLGNGSNTWVEVNAAIQSLAGSGALSFGAWVVSLGNSPSVGGRTVMAVNPLSSSGTDSNRWLLQSEWGSGVGYFFLNGPSITYVSEPAGSHAIGDVVFVVANVGTGKQELFTNGALAASASSAGQTIAASDRFSIGQDFDGISGTSEHWIGPLDGAFLFNRHLTAGEVAALYSAGQAGTYETDLLAMSGLVSLWPLDDLGCPGFRIGKVGIGMGRGIA